MSSRITPTDRLRQDAEEISSALDDFMKQRAAVVDAQQEALNQYASEMQEIGQLDDDVEADEEAPAPELFADHNMRFHNSMNEGSGGEEVVDKTQETRETGDFPEAIIKKPKKKKVFKQNHAKMPSPEEKIGIRVQIFKFLDESREEARVLEAEMEEARKEGDKNGFAALTKLCDAQRASYVTLMDYLSLYQPAPFAKGMNNDPDYIELVSRINSKIEAKTSKVKSTKRKGDK